MALSVLPFSLALVLPAFTLACQSSLYLVFGSPGLNDLGSQLQARGFFFALVNLTKAPPVGENEVVQETQSNSSPTLVPQF